MKTGKSWVWWVALAASMMWTPSYVQCQKVTLLSMPEQNRYAFNPGYAGLEGSLDIAVWGREQWAGIDGGPSTQGLNAHMPLYALRGAIGLRAMVDDVGPFRYQTIDIGYAYVVDRDRYILSIGANAGWQGIRFDGTGIRTLDGIYTGGQIDHQDPSIANADLSGGTATLSLGIYYIRDGWEGGVSIDRWSIGEVNLSEAPLGFDWAPSASMHGYFTTGWTLSDRWDMAGHLFAQYDTYHLQTMIKASATYDDELILGIGWRGYHQTSLDALVTSVGYVVDRHLSLHYSYDIGLSGLAQVSNGSHELILRYNLDQRIGSSAPRVIGNPRVLK